MNKLFFCVTSLFFLSPLVAQPKYQYYNYPLDTYSYSFPPQDPFYYYPNYYRYGNREYWKGKHGWHHGHFYQGWHGTHHLHHSIKGHHTYGRYNHRTSRGHHFKTHGGHGGTHESQIRK